MAYYPLPTILPKMAHAPYSDDKIKFTEHGALPPPITLTIRGGGDFGRSVTTFSTPKAPKNGNFWKILGKIVFSDHFLAPQAPKIL